MAATQCCIDGETLQLLTRPGSWRLLLQCTAMGSRKGNGRFALTMVPFAMATRSEMGGVGRRTGGAFEVTSGVGDMRLGTVNFSAPAPRRL